MLAQKVVLGDLYTLNRQAVKQGVFSEPRAGLLCYIKGAVLWVGAW